jgi:hypothetical protein
MPQKSCHNISEIYTQVIPVVTCSDMIQVKEIMARCRIPRALTYNKLGSVQGWGIDWKKADLIIRTILKPTDIGLPSKLWEWSVSDTMKAILAQQEGAKTFLIKEIYRHTANTDKRKVLLSLLKTNRNRYRLRHHGLNHSDKTKSKKILKHNLGYQVKSQKLKNEKATIQNFIRSDLRRNITSPVFIYIIP